MMNRKVLFVDDDVNILASFRRQFRKGIEVFTAEGGHKGLESMTAYGPFAVVVADMRMPGMDGIEFLSRVKKAAPETVRVMLTGNADMDTAVNAVNEGNIFRFLIKPCPYDVLLTCLNAAIRQYELELAEKVLLKKTLAGSIKVLIDVLGLVNPNAFSRASRIKRYVTAICRLNKVRETWQFEIAAMLSQIGCVAIPEQLLDKLYSNIDLQPDERKMYLEHPEIGYGLLSKIPRMEKIAHIIRLQQRRYSDYTDGYVEEKDETVILGSQILKVAIDFDQLVYGGMSTEEAADEMKFRNDQYNPEILKDLSSLQKLASKTRIRIISIKDLAYGMIADEDIVSGNGLTLVARGQEITYPVMAKLKNFSKQMGVNEPFRVLAPDDE